MGKIIARCRGHSSWVLAVAFDNNIDSDRMRFASVGEDTNLCLWDLVLSGLNPRTRLTLSRSLVGVNSTVENGFSGRNVVPVIGPILITKISDNPVCMVNFTEEGIVTADRQGLVKVWMRSATLENKK